VRGKNSLQQTGQKRDAFCIGRGREDKNAYPLSSIASLFTTN
jgi:hypothetical protein